MTVCKAMCGIVVVLPMLWSCRTGNDFSLNDKEIVISDAFFSGVATLEKLSSMDGYKLSLINDSGKILDKTIFRYNAYQFDTIDVDHDGSTEILLGLIKETQFDPQARKRLFILRIQKGQIRPMWLGSRVCQELVDFKSASNGIVRTLERNRNNKYAIGSYRWQGFGLALIEYTYDEISFSDALQLY